MGVISDKREIVPADLRTFNHRLFPLSQRVIHVHVDIHSFYILLNLSFPIWGFFGRWIVILKPVRFFFLITEKYVSLCNHRVFISGKREIVPADLRTFNHRLFPLSQCVIHVDIHYLYILSNLPLNQGRR